MTRVNNAVIPIALTLAVAASDVTLAAGFDCAKASTAVERMVCDDPALSRLDDVLADAYRRAMADSVEPAKLKAEQREWLRAHRDICSDAGCLKRAYEIRIGQLHDRGRFTAANGMDETELAEFLRAELDLKDQPFRPRFVAVRSASETVARRVVFFIAGQGAVRRGLIDVSRASAQLLRVEDYNCGCQGVSAASAMRLVAAEPDFVFASYGGGGTCVGGERLDVFRIGEGGVLELVWQGATYAADSPAPGVHEAEIAEISFPRMRGGPDRAILRAAKRVRCDDDNCFCQDGPGIDAYLELFVWDADAGQFRPAR